MNETENELNNTAADFSLLLLLHVQCGKNLLCSRFQNIMHTSGRNTAGSVLLILVYHSFILYNPELPGSLDIFILPLHSHCIVEAEYNNIL